MLLLYNYRTSSVRIQTWIVLNNYIIILATIVQHSSVHRVGFGVFYVQRLWNHTKQIIDYWDVTKHTFITVVYTLTWDLVGHLVHSSVLKLCKMRQNSKQSDKDSRRQPNNTLVCCFCYLNSFRSFRVVHLQITLKSTNYAINQIISY